MRGRHRAAALAAVALLVAGRANAASPRARVAIALSGGMDTQGGLGRDLPLEFRAEGFDVHVVDADLDAQSIDDWADRARSDDDAAMIHVTPGAAGDALIEVLLVTPSSLLLKDTIHYVPSDTSDIASVRAVEVTRAALLDDEPTHENGHPPFEKDEAKGAAPEPESRPFAVFVAPHVALMGTVPLAQLGLGASASWAPSPRTEYEIEGTFPLTRPSDGVTGSAVYARVTLLSAGVSYYFAPPRHFLRPFAGVRIGTALFATDPSQLGDKTTLPAFFGAGTAGVSMKIYDSLRLRGGATVGVSVPQLALRANGSVVERAGLPIVLFQVGPEATW